MRWTAALAAGARQQVDRAAARTRLRNRASPAWSRSSRASPSAFFSRWNTRPPPLRLRPQRGRGRQVDLLLLARCRRSCGSTRERGAAAGFGARGEQALQEARAAARAASSSSSSSSTSSSSIACGGSSELAAAIERLADLVAGGGDAAAGADIAADADAEGEEHRRRSPRSRSGSWRAAARCPAPAARSMESRQRLQAAACRRRRSAAAGR